MAGRTWLLGGAILGMLAVVLGAFGAHGLETSITTWGLDPDEQTKRLHNWEVGVRYQMYHALALLVLGFMSALRPSRFWHIAGLLFVIGVLIFSGCLYLYVFSGLKWFGMVVPIGGVALIAGWAGMMIAIWQTANSVSKESQG
jgi:uncharacterized membrane protein YgdD (TMEM256/DUF423 family)